MKILIETDLQTAIVIKESLLIRIDNISRLQDLYKMHPQLQEYYNKQYNEVNNIITQINNIFFKN